MKILRFFLLLALAMIIGAAAQAAEKQGMSIDDYLKLADGILTFFGVVSLVFCPVALPYIRAIKKGKDELVHVLDKSPTENNDLLRLARREHKQRAVKQIERMIENR